MPALTTEPSTPTPPAEAPAHYRDGCPIVAPAVDEAPSNALLADLADALDVLLPHVGRPLPKFLLLDVPALQALVERARRSA